MGNAQSDGKNQIKRVEFVFQGTSYKFLLNPEEYTQLEPNRVNATQTKAGAWIDDFGGGIASIQMKGTTGFKRNGDPTTGFEKFKELRDTIRSFYSKVPPGTEITSANELVFYNYTDGDHWIVTPKTFQLMRSIARPTLYVYDIQLICERPASMPSAVSSTIAPTVGRIS